MLEIDFENIMGQESSDEEMLSDDSECANDMSEYEIDRVGIAPAIFAHLCLFFADYREHTAHHLYYNLPTYFLILFTIIFFECVQSGHMLHENILYKGPLQFVHDLPSSLPKEPAS